MAHNKYSILTTSELLLAVANSTSPTDLEVALAERLEEVYHALEDYEPTYEPETRYL